MRYVVVRDTALGMLEQFKRHGCLEAGQREKLSAPVSAALGNRHEQDLVSLKSQDETPGVDLQMGRKGHLEIHRGPQKNESFEHTLHTEARYGKSEVHRHETATLKGEDEPYQETWEFTRFGQAGIEHVSITVTGNGVNLGGIHGRAEFIARNHEDSWYERTYQDIRSADLLSIYQQGTY